MFYGAYRVTTPRRVARESGRTQDGRGGDSESSTAGRKAEKTLVLCVLQEDRSRSTARTNNVVVTAISSLPRQATEIDAT